MVTIKVSDGKGGVLGKIKVYRSGPNVGLSIVIPGPERGGAAIALDMDELEELINGLRIVQAEVEAQD
jgi:hypothetical protein